MEDNIEFNLNNPISMNDFGTEASISTLNYLSTEKYNENPNTEKDNSNNNFNYDNTSMQSGGAYTPDLNVQKTLKACKDKEYAAFSYLIRNDFVSNYAVADVNTKSTFLHCIAQNYYKIPHVKNVLTKILNSPAVGNIINFKNTQGKTPLHIAVENNNHDLASILIHYGADKNIRDPLNRNILSDYEDEPSIFARRNTHSQSPKYAQTDDDTKNFIVAFLDVNTLKNFDNELSNYSINMTTDLKDTEVYQPKKTQSEDLLGTETFINNLLKAMPYVKDFSGGGKKNGKKNQVNLNEDVAEIYGRRRMNLYSEFNDINEDINFDNLGLHDNATSTTNYDTNRRAYSETSENDQFQDSEMGGLSRQIKNKVDIIHERTIEKIKEIMNVSEDIARNYKSALYYEVKTKHPELNAYDRAIEMEKLATKDNLDNIDIDKVTKDIEKFRAEKSKTKKDFDKKSKKKSRSKTKSKSKTSRAKKTKKTKKKSKSPKQTTNRKNKRSEFSLTSSAFNDDYTDISPSSAF
jgi:Ankyrin repeat.